MSSVQRKKQTIAWWHYAGLLSGAAFAAMLACAYFSPNTLDIVDSLVTQRISSLQSFATVEVFLVITALGGSAGIITVALGVVFFLRNSRQSIVRLFILLFCSGVAVDLAKTFVERARPNVLEWFNPLASFSFPSGHATLSMALYGFIAVSLYRRVNSWGAKILSILIPGILILGIGLSRMILNFHYATDVFAGFLLGFFLLSLTYMLPRSLIDIGK